MVHDGGQPGGLTWVQLRASPHLFDLHIEEAHLLNHLAVAELVLVADTLLTLQLLVHLTHLVLDVLQLVHHALDLLRIVVLVDHLAEGSRLLGLNALVADDLLLEAEVLLLGCVHLSQHLLERSNAWSLVGLRLVRTVFLAQLLNHLDVAMTLPVLLPDDVLQRV